MRNIILPAFLSIKFFTAHCAQILCRTGLCGKRSGLGRVHVVAGPEAEGRFVEGPGHRPPHGGHRPGVRVGLGLPVGGPTCSYRQLEILPQRKTQIKISAFAFLFLVTPIGGGGGGSPAKNTANHFENPVSHPREVGSPATRYWCGYSHNRLLVSWEMHK